MSSVWTDLKKGKVQPVYCIIGTEQYVIDEAIRKIEEALATVSYEVTEYDLERTPVEAVIEEADTIPFFTEKKYIIARHASFLKPPERGKEQVEHYLDSIYRYLEHPSPSAVVVFTAPYEKLDGRKKVTKFMKEHATIIEADPLEGPALLKWVQKRAQVEGTTLSTMLAEKLLARVGDELLKLSTEIEKLATYANGEPITEEMIEQLITQTPEMNVFALTDAYIQGDTNQALAIYHDLLANGNEPIALNALIAGQIRLMLHVTTLRQKGYERYEIAKLLKVHHYRVKLVLDNRQLPSPERLMEILYRLATIDFKLKTTSIKREHLLDIFFSDPIRTQ